jgi:hypothetical protein
MFSIIGIRMRSGFNSAKIQQFLQTTKENRCFFSTPAFFPEFRVLGRLLQRKRELYFAIWKFLRTFAQIIIWNKTFI